jgi:sec-independent protein translocase protein TatA
MCGLGQWELLVILGIILLLFGAKKLPELAKGLGGAVRALKKSANEPDELEEPSDGEKPAAPKGKPPEDRDGGAKPPA